MAITTIDSLHYKIILYFLSFILRMIEKLVVFVMKKKEKINKAIFYYIIYHNRIHFFLLNFLLSGGIFLNTRTILHMKLYPEKGLFLVDKMLAIIVFIFYWIDIIEMLTLALKYVKLQKDD